MISEKKLKNKRRLVVFTSTFASEMGGIKDLLVLLGKREKTIEIHREYLKRKYFGPWGLDKIANLYQGFLEKKLKDFSYEYCSRYFLRGLREFVKELKERGFIVGSVDSNFHFLKEATKEMLSLDFSIGTQLKVENETITGQIEREVNRYTEREILKEKMKEYNIEKENVIVIGRPGVTHDPISREAGLCINFFPQENILKQVVKKVFRDKRLKRYFEN